MTIHRADGAYPIRAFQVINSRALRHANVRGSEVSIALISDGSVEIVGKEGGYTVIRMVDLERLRIGFADGKRRIYSAKVWRADGSGSIELFPDSGQWGAYRTFMERWAALLAEHHRLDRVELGLSKIEAVLLPAAFFLLFAGAALVALFALRREPWWGRMMVPLVPATLFVTFLFLSITRLWPRRLENVRDVVRFLPPA